MQEAIFFRGLHLKAGASLRLIAVLGVLQLSALTPRGQSETFLNYLSYFQDILGPV